MILPSWSPRSESTELSSSIPSRRAKRCSLWKGMGTAHERWEHQNHHPKNRLKWDITHRPWERYDHQRQEMPNENAEPTKREIFFTKRHGIWAIFRGTQVGSVEKTCSAKAWWLKIGRSEKEEPGSQKNTFESNRQSQSFGGWTS
jgi:hypothetical protein